MSGNDIYRSCFRIFSLSWHTWSTIIRWRPLLSAAIVTPLVTRLQARGRACLSMRTIVNEVNEGRLRIWRDRSGCCRLNQRRGCCTLLLRELINSPLHHGACVLRQERTELQPSPTQRSALQPPWPSRSWILGQPGPARSGLGESGRMLGPQRLLVPGRSQESGLSRAHLPPRLEPV